MIQRCIGSKKKSILKSPVKYNLHELNKKILHNVENKESRGFWPELGGL